MHTDVASAVRPPPAWKDGTVLQYEGGAKGNRGKMLKAWFPPKSTNASPKAAAILAKRVLPQRAPGSSIAGAESI